MVRYKIIWKIKALKQAATLPEKERTRISDTVETLSDKVFQVLNMLFISFPAWFCKAVTCAWLSVFEFFFDIYITGIFHFP